MLRRALVAASIGALAACAHAPLPASTADFTRLREASDAPAVVLLDEQQVRFEWPPRAPEPVAVVTLHRRLGILREEGRSLAHHAVAYSASDEIVAFESWATSPNGRVIAVADRSVSDEPLEPRGVLFSDLRRRDAQLGGAPLGSIVEFRSEVRHGLVPHLTFGQAFGSNVPVQREVLRVIVPTGLEIEWRSMQGGRDVALEPRLETQPDGQRRYTWEQENLAPVEGDTRAPNAWWASPSVTVRLKSWTDGTREARGFAGPQEMSQWLAATDALRSPGGEDLRRTAVRVAGDGTPEQRAQRLFDWVRDEIDYSAVELGMGGWIPHMPDDVHRLRLGDCKDKANLLRTMLKVVGVESHVLLVQVHEGLPRPIRLPVLGGGFNHAVLAVDLAAGLRFADPTMQDAAFGEIPGGIQGSPMLSVDDRGAPFAVVPVVAAGASTRTVVIDLDARPPLAQGTLRIDATGTLAHSFRHALRSIARGDWHRVVEGSEGLAGLRTTVVATAPLPPPGTPVKLEARIQAAALERAGRWALVTPAAFVPAALPPMPNADRKLPLLLGPRRRLHDLVSLRLPRELVVDTLPPPVNVKDARLEFSLKWTRKSDVLTLDREVTVLDTSVPVAELDGLRKALERMQRADGTSIVLRPSGGAR